MDAKKLPQNKHCVISQHFRNAQLQGRRFQMSPDEHFLRSYFSQENLSGLIREKHRPG